MSKSRVPDLLFHCAALLGPRPHSRPERPPVVAVCDCGNRVRSPRWCEIRRSRVTCDPREDTQAWLAVVYFVGRRALSREPPQVG
eukprot:7460499-Alexandrium_andersonii.AAC.1